MPSSNCKQRKSCRLCESYNLKTVIDLNTTPLANSFLSQIELNKKENYYPLKVNYCSHCHHLQLSHSVSAKSMFDKYLYLSNTSKQNRDHFKDYALDLESRVKEMKKVKILDIASNDGTFLKFFNNKKFNKLGIDPAKNLSVYAKQKGIKQLAIYFNYNNSKLIKSNYGTFDIISANHVCAHVDDLSNLIKGVKNLLKQDGIFSLEVSYLVDVIKKKTFDIIYHEHVDYHSLKPLINFFKRFNLEIFDFKTVEAQGGSIRIYVSHKGSKKLNKKKINKQISLESKKYKLFKISTYKNFEVEINKTKNILKNLLNKIKNQNKTIAGYGAAAKTTTLLNYFNIGNEIIDFIVDDNRLKQNRFTPGTHIPIFNSKELYKKKPDYVILLAWNYSNFIIKTHNKFLKIGGNFIIPFPKIKIIKS